MKKKIIESLKFKKDFRNVVKSGKYKVEYFYTVVEYLVEGTPLPKKYFDHVLIGNWSGHRECHIKPNWLLIYIENDDSIELVRTGSHSQLFE